MFTDCSWSLSCTRRTSSSSKASSRPIVCRRVCMTVGTTPGAQHSVVPGSGSAVNINTQGHGRLRPLATALKAYSIYQGRGNFKDFREQSSFRHAEAFCKDKMHQIHFRLGLCPGPRWRSLRRSAKRPNRLGMEIKPPHSPLHSKPATPQPLIPL